MVGGKLTDNRGVSCRQIFPRTSFFNHNQKLTTVHGFLVTAFPHSSFWCHSWWSFEKSGTGRTFVVLVPAVCFFLEGAVTGIRLLTFLLKKRNKRSCHINVMKNTKCGSTGKSKNQCSLIEYVWYYQYQKISSWFSVDTLCISIARQLNDRDQNVWVFKLSKQLKLKMTSSEFIQCSVTIKTEQKKTNILFTWSLLCSAIMSLGRSNNTFEVMWSNHSETLETSNIFTL